MYPAAKDRISFSGVLLVYFASITLTSSGLQYGVDYEACGSVNPNRNNNWLTM